MAQQVQPLATPVICRRHTWQRTKTPGLFTCTKCGATGRRQEQLAQQLPASPNYVGHDAGMHDESQPYWTGNFRAQQNYVSRVQPIVTSAQTTRAPVDGEYNDVWPPRMPNSTLRYPQNTQFTIHQGPPPAQERRGPHTRDIEEPEIPLSGKKEKRHRIRAMLRDGHPLLYLGIGMVGMLVLWTVLVFLIGWVVTTLDDLHYGRPRTFQIDAVVGHNDSVASPSHFIAINLNGHIEVIEMPGGDASHARIYIGPQLYGANANLVPVTLSFKDMMGNGKPDMLIHFQGSEVVFVNDNGQFRPVKPGEQVTPQ